VEHEVSYKTKDLLLSTPIRIEDNSAMVKQGFFLNGEAVFNMYTLLDINISIFAFLNGCAWDFFINISTFAFLCSSRSPRAMIAAENCVILQCPRDNGLDKGRA